MARGPRGARRCKYSLRGGGQFKKARGIGTHRRRQYRLLRNRKGKGFTFSGGSYKVSFDEKRTIRVISEEVEKKTEICVLGSIYFFHIHRSTHTPIISYLAQSDWYPCVKFLSMLCVYLQYVIATVPGDIGLKDICKNLF